MWLWCGVLDWFAELQALAVQQAGIEAMKQHPTK
jgi:hypothetical protein